MAEALVDLDPAGARAPRSAKPCSFNMKAPERVPSRAPTPKPLPLGYGEARLTIGPGRIRDKFSSKPFVPELQTTFQPPPRQSMPWPKPARAGRSHLSRSSRAIGTNVTVRKTNVALRPLRKRGWEDSRQHHHAARARRCDHRLVRKPYQRQRRLCYRVCDIAGAR